MQVEEILPHGLPSIAVTWYSQCVAARLRGFAAGGPAQLGDENRQLDAALQSCQQMASCLSDLLDLADAAAELAVSLESTAAAHPAPDPWQAARRLQALCQGVHATTRLLRYGLPACGSQHDRSRVLAAVALLLAAGKELQRLSPLLPNASSRTSCLGQQALMRAFDHCTAVSWFCMAEALAPQHTLPPQLGPQKVLTWLHQAADAVEMLQGSIGLGDSLCLGGVFLALAGLAAAGNGALGKHRRALAEDAQLCSQLGALTAASYAVLPRWRCHLHDGAGALAHTKLLDWVGSWWRLPWPHGAAHPRLLPVLAGLCQEAGEAYQAHPLWSAIAAGFPLSEADWALLPPSPCHGLGRALPAVLARCEAEAARLVQHLPNSDRQRLQVLALSLARTRADLPAPLARHMMARFDA